MNITFTNHAKAKMAFYKISPSLVKRVIRHPERTEEGILPNTVAAMRKSGEKKDREVWTMYVIDAPQSRKGGTIQMEEDESNDEKVSSNWLRGRGGGLSRKKIGLDKEVRVITAWIYPGTSPERDPVPAKILEEMAMLRLGL